MSKEELTVDVKDAEIKIDGKVAEVKLNSDTYKNSFTDPEDYKKALEIAKHNAKYFDATVTAVGELTGKILKDNKEVEAVNTSAPFINQTSTIEFKSLRAATFKIPGTEDTVTKSTFTAKVELQNMGSRANVKRQSATIMEILERK
jgi:hypothetical protein